MRRWLGLLLVLALSACAPPRARQAAPGGVARTTIVVYEPHGEEVMAPFKARFEQAHPEIEVKYVTMGSEAILGRLTAEKANPYADVWWGAPHTMFIQGGKRDLLSPYMPSWHDKVTPAQHDINDLWYGQWLTPSVIVFNSEALTNATAPQDWDDLLKPEWKGKIVIRNPVDSGTMRTFIAAMILRQPTEAQGFAWLKGLDANTRAYLADPTLLQRALANRTGVVTVWALRDVEIQKRTHGYKLGYNLPKSGCPTVLDGIALVKGSKHLEAAKVFYEYVTAPEQLVWAANQFDCMPARSDIDPKLLPARMPRNVPEIKLDWNKVEANLSRWIDLWGRTVRTPK